MQNIIDEASKVSRAEYNAQMDHMRDVYESAISELTLRIDDIGWRAFGDIDNKGVKLSTLKKIVESNNDTISANTLIGRAVRVRTSYVFGQGLEFYEDRKTNAKGGGLKELIKNSNVFSRADQMRLENAATATGNIFLLATKRGGTKRIVNIPLSQIVGYVEEVDPIDGVKMFIREYTYTENGETKKNRVAYLTDHAAYTKSTIVFNDEVINIDPHSRIVHIKFNAIDEWVFGVPDLYGTHFWSNAYKRAMESDIKVKDALSKFAWKVTASTKAGVNKAATEIAGTHGAGGVAGFTEGNQLAAINKAGAGVNFNENWPLAAIVAAGFDIPLDELIHQSTSTNSTLSETNTYVLSMRQELWCEALERAFDAVGMPTNVVAPRLFAEPVHRVAQAISVLSNTNLLHPDELREAAVLQLKRYGVQNFEDKLPEDGAWLKFAKGETENPGTTPLNTPDNTGTADKRSPGGTLSDGDNNLRDEG